MTATPSRPRLKDANPFYVALVVVGIAFTLTASAFWVETEVAARRMRGQVVSAGAESSGTELENLTPSFMRHWGGRLLGVELALLVVLALLAMACDQRRAGRSAAESGRVTGGDTTAAFPAEDS